MQLESGQVGEERRSSKGKKHQCEGDEEGLTCESKEQQECQCGQKRKRMMEGEFRRRDKFTAIWMDLGINIVSEIRQRQIPYDTTYGESKI